MRLNYSIAYPVADISGKCVDQCSHVSPHIVIDADNICNCLESIPEGYTIYSIPCGRGREKGALHVYKNGLTQYIKWLIGSGCQHAFMYAQQFKDTY